jgi:hypothetical protein
MDVIGIIAIGLIVLFVLLAVLAVIGSVAEVVPGVAEDTFEKIQKMSVWRFAILIIVIAAVGLGFLKHFA